MKYWRIWLYLLCIGHWNILWDKVQNICGGFGGGDSGSNINMAANHQNNTNRVSTTSEITPSVPISYSRSDLLRKQFRCSKLDTRTIASLKEMGIYRNRGRRGGKHIRRNILTRVTNRSERKETEVKPNESRVLITPPIVKIDKHKARAPPTLLITNPQSLTNVYEEFYAQVRLLQPDIVGVSETWFSEIKPAHQYSLPGYELFHKDRVSRGGGVALYVKDTFVTKNIEIAVPENVECVWVVIEQKFAQQIKRLCVCRVYHPPAASSHDDLVEHLITTTDTLRSNYTDMRTVIMGDCNNLNVANIMANLELRCIVNQPTHGNSMIDLILTDAEFYITSSVHPPIGLSRHLCVLCQPEATPAPPPYTVRVYRPFLDSSVRSFGQWITAQDWSTVLSVQDADEAADLLEGMVRQQYEVHFPEQQQRMRRDNKPWISARILRLMDQRRRAYSRGRMDKWRQLYFRVKAEIKAAKKATALGTEENNINSVHFSKNLRCILGTQKKKLKIPFLDHLDTQIIGEKIKQHFTNICTTLPSLDHSQLPSFLPISDTTSIDRISVYKSLKQLKIIKASPPGSLPKRLIKEFAYEISLPLTYVYNLCLSNGIFPSRWKEATIVALPKKKVISQLGDLRPLSLTPDLGKILEGYVAMLVLEDIRPNLDPFQYGNLKGKSTSHYLVMLLNSVLKGLDVPKRIALIVLIDFKKAFDYIDHTVALTELFLLGCRPSLLMFVANFLSNRKHRVRYEDIISDYDMITCGVPQGTRLGPIIFLAVINRLCRNSPIHVKYVDDLTIMEIVDVDNTVTFTMQNTLDDLDRDCEVIKMCPNPLKCEVMIVCPPKRPIIFPQLKLSGHELPIVHSCKLLGLHINSDLTWNHHITHIISRASSLLFILYRARQFSFSPNVMFTLYSWHIRTVLEYAAPVWHPGLTQAQHNSLEKLQKRCFRIILGEGYLNYNHALQLLDTESLYKRREAATIKFGQGLLSTPELRNMLPQTLYDVHGRETRRGSQLLQSVRCRTSRYQKSPIPYIVSKLNAL